MDLQSIISTCFPCLPCFQSPYVAISNNKYKIIRLLGEGGFSYVYLVADRANNNALYALKKIRCPFGASDELFRNAVREIRNYHRFAAARTPYIIQSIEESVVEESDGSKSIYIVMPYFEKSLQDVINEHVLSDQSMDEAEIIKIFVGVCRGLKVMHNYKKRLSGLGQAQAAADGGEGDLLLPESEDDDEGDGEMGTQMLELVPFAHHDIKPANVMLSAEGLPVLVDLGSCSAARIHIKSRQQALTMTDFAQEHCTLPYRAPELLDVATNADISEKTDIWSLGCLLYCCCFGFSPFEKLEIEQGANLTLVISQGNYVIPEDRRGYSEALMDLVRECLVVDPKQRPTIETVLEKALELSRQAS
ncbi:kinase-like protein [Suhomyces tanzawaensis NRRL Y-17324]|uniref:non-specific serine/threonine protein kinase n=1 Tax=Suhomyces tanzawaensis NRRL Y-17324 TaxID=984487 RepID=A0A1E4SMK0_9ASCO|nr:kinase-like protein [Suhomyces tanzawaensis NRRL Y-17324]ODV80740.1 kinase-like protein [Suhomyces tanzawaensis NRRL Y-17324]